MYPYGVEAGTYLFSLEWSLEFVHDFLISDRLLKHWEHLLGPENHLIIIFTLMFVFLYFKIKSVP